ncbi:L-serine ammonia-lyase, iron-sulfur-dependent, subunit alpha [Clostridium sp. HMP27]|uniref:L-cysteine desulfidase family protein n=1 Tax=Clostridium sp. HMP27 TaxID=1487921 RepID=UPI00052BCF18|nr:L-serine ammonia-lyase, iron-sulfur-dependent, subunit alpha [Clostridium sp. HMP27]KGK87624.1 hypothetical protein DP68_10030 [Clostridium sp. HMP27]
MNEELLLNILKNQVTPALGCTEPGAVAYAVAVAKEALHEEVKSLEIIVDKNILKNGMEVGIPGTKEKGIIFAAALSLVMGKSEYKLEALKGISEEDIQKAFKIVNEKIIKLNLKDDISGLYIEVIAKGIGNISISKIRNTHLNLVSVSRNEEILFEKEEVLANNEEKKEDASNLRDRIREFTISDLIMFVNEIDYEKIKFIDDGIQMNMAMGNVGLKGESGIGIAKFYSKLEGVENKAKALTAAASEARMSGYPLPVMSSAGSGNHGLVAILPIAFIGQEKGIEEEKIIRAVALSHLVTIFVKSYTGSLTPVCGCGVAAGVGSSAGLTYLLGGNTRQIEGAISNMIAGLTGMICDGAKIGCAYKLAISVASALDASELALNDVVIPSNNGILDESVEKTIQNLGRVSNEGMDHTDSVILDVMVKKCI